MKKRFFCLFKMFSNFVSTFLIILFLFGFVNAYIDKSTLLGDIKFTASGAQNSLNASYGGDNLNYNKFYNSTSGFPYGYVSAFNYSYDRQFARVGLGNGIESKVLTYSFWSINSDKPIFQNNGIELRNIGNNYMGLFIDGEKLGDLSVAPGWHLFTLYIDTNSKKIKIYIDGTNQIYSFNTDKTKLFSSNQLAVYTVFSTLRFYNKILSDAEIVNVYKEASNVKSNLTLHASGSIITFNTKTDVLNLNLGKVTDLDSSKVDIEYSINGGSYVPYTGISFSKPNNQDISLSLNSDLFFYGANTISIRTYDGYTESNILTYTVNKNFFEDPSVSTGTLVGNFYFNEKLTSQTGNNTFIGTGSYIYNKSFVFPIRYISFQNTNGSMQYNNNGANIETVIFYTKGIGELLNNTYFSLNYDLTNGFGFDRGTTRYLNIGPKDNNWHLVALKLDKINDRLYVDIDGGKYKDYIMYYRDDIVGSLKFKIGSFAFIKTYSNQLSDDDIINLYKFYNIYKPTISATSTGLILKTVEDNLLIPVTVNDLDELQTIEYYYSIDGNDYSKIDNLTIKTPVTNVSNTLILTGSIFGTGNNNLFIKAFDGKDYSNILNFTVNKTATSLDISIDESGLYKVGSKILKASINGGNLFYAITKEGNCDETLSFQPYTKDLVFSESTDNGSKVCFKGVYYDDIIYKLSREINGIGDKTSTIKNSDVFFEYYNWKKGILKDFDPIFILIKSIVTKNVSGGTQFTTNYPNLVTDVNGDGLPDLVITNYSYSIYQYISNDGKIINSPSGSNNYYYALLLNKGNMDYELKYRCVYLADGIASGYYGDCAQ